MGVLEERTCSLGGRRVRYRVAGDGPPILLVHGLGGSWRWWRPVAELLAPRHRLYVVDLPGFGSARGQPFVLDETPAYLRALAAALELERPHLVGHSLGGAVCARYAALWPRAVDRLVLVAPAAMLDRGQPLRYALPLLATVRHVRPAFLPVLVTDALRAGVRTLYRAGGELLGTDSARAEVGTVTVPTLLIWGARDKLVPLRFAERYARRIPHSRLVVLTGAGHVPMIDRPEDFARAVIAFIDTARR